MTNFFPLPEWYPQDAVILVWPHRYSDWASTLDNIEHTYLALAKTISSFQSLFIIYFDHQHKESIVDQCSNFGCNLQAITFFEIETNDTWVRDYGPLFLLGHDSYKYLDFEFNAWGEQYAHRLDNLFAESFFNQIKPSSCEYMRLPLVLEGGNLDFDGNATVMTNISCIINNNTNSNLKVDDLLPTLQQFLGVKKILDLRVEPLAGDDTGGHIDTLARFINDDSIVYATTSNTADPNYYCLKSLYHQLRKLVTRKGAPYKLIPVLMPEKCLLDGDGNILPASYINFIFINNAMIVPLYNDNHDSLALNTFSKICPDRKIVGVDAIELIKQFGSLHCATLNIPSKVLNESRTSSTN